jgi:hypothetical protein
MSKRLTKRRQNHSSKSNEITRVKSRKKQAKKTVGITLPPHIIKEARKHNLNISRITEQALLSILDYLESSKPINMSKCESISQQPRRAGSSAWHERLTCTQEDAGSNPARSTIVADGTRFRGKIRLTL